MIASLLISILSIVVGVAIIALFRAGMGVAGSFIILSVLGAPLTFLQRIFWVFDGSPLPLYGMYFLYFLQYQLLAVAVYKYHDHAHLRIYGLVIGMIMMSAIIMYCFQMGKF